MSDPDDSNTPAKNPDELSDLGRNLMGSSGGHSRSGQTPAGSGAATGSGGIKWLPPTAEELSALLPGYEISRMLGRGGMGAVYMGRQKSLDRPVAIKILSSELEEADAGFSDRFKNEARSMAKLNHPGIVGVYDFGETENGLLFIVMEYVDGTDVARMITADGRLHTDHAMAITAHVCDALAYAHGLGIIHRDIKPANIMVGYDGVVKVADFGLAKAQSENPESAGLTMSGAIMGTMHYMAPESMIVGSVNVDHRADIYAVGVMLYHMLTGKVPHGIFELPSMQVAGLDPRYDGIIAKAMREDRDQRYSDAHELRSDLDAILTQPVAQVEATGDQAGQAPAALPTDARPQRPGGRPSGGRRSVGGRSLVMGQAAEIARSAAEPAPKQAGGSVKLATATVVFLLIAAGGWWWMQQNKSGEAGLATNFPSTDETALIPPSNEANKPSAQSTEPPSTREKANPTANNTPASPDNEATAAPVASNEPTEVLFGDWRPLFPDGTLRNWTGNVDGFTLENGVLTQLGRPDPETGGLISPQEFGSFSLRFELQLTKGANSGIGIWCDQVKPADQNLSFTGFEVQVVDDKPTYKPWQRHGAIFGFQGPTSSPMPSVGNWVPHEITVIGDVIRVTVNGVAVVEGKIPDNAPQDRERTNRIDVSTKTGHLAFLDHIGVVKFRNLEIRELAASDGGGFPSHLSHSENGWIDLLPSVNPDAVTLGQASRLSDGSVKWHPTTGRAGRSLVPLTNPTISNYELELSVTLDSKNEWGQIGVSFPVTSRGRATWVVNKKFMDHPNPGEHYGAIEAVDGNSISDESNPTRYFPNAIERGKRHTARLRVFELSNTEVKVEAWIDNVKKIEWSGNPSRLSLTQPDWAGRDPERIWVGRHGNQCEFTLHEVRFRSLSAPPPSTSSATPTTSKSILGTWWQRIELNPGNSHRVTVNDDGTCLLNTGGSKFAGSWKSGPEAITFEWSNGVSCRFPFASAADSAELMIGTGTMNGKQPFTVQIARDLEAPWSGPAKETATHDSTTSALGDKSNKGESEGTSKETPFENSLGMKFLSVPGTEVLFCIHEVRYKDYKEYARKSRESVNDEWKDQTIDRHPVEKDHDDHPVMKVSWEDAKKFCAWLSEKEGRSYRLPTDREWSIAVGIGDLEEWSIDTTPATVSKARDIYPWGERWPPPAGAGNYSDETRQNTDRRDLMHYAGYDDGFTTTAPVMSFMPNKFGLYDLGGNVWEWCEDWWDNSNEQRTLRGASWGSAGLGAAFSSARHRHAPNHRSDGIGFRIVLIQ